MSIHPNFKLVGIEPGIVITFQFGAVDFRNPVPLTVLETLYKDGFEYLKLTKQGEKAYAPKIVVPSTAPTSPDPETPGDNQPAPSKPKTKYRGRKN